VPRPPRQTEFLAFEDVTLRLGEKAVFRKTNWTWRSEEQWAILGPDNSGKSLLIEAILGRTPVLNGEVRGPSSEDDDTDSISASVIAHLSPLTQRNVAGRESTFYQQRWHSGLEHASRSVRDFFSAASVYDHNPFEIGADRRNQRRFQNFRRQLVDWLGVKGLWRRKLVQLSNGEMRKTLLIHELLKFPGLTILEDAYAGLDSDTRLVLAKLISRLMRQGWLFLIVTNRVEEIPAPTTHLLLVERYKVLAQGPKQAMLRLWRERLDARRPRLKHASHPRSFRSRNGAPATRALVELRNVTITGAKRTILRNINWTLREGECWAILGPNGAGKTTLLNLIQGDHPKAYSEHIRMFGRRTDSTQALWRARSKIGCMSPELHQHYPSKWAVEEVVCSGFFNSIGLHQSCSHGRRTIARKWLKTIGLQQHADTAFGELSFGEQRLVLLARAAVKKPRLLILDEPCQGLDAQQRRIMLNETDRVVAESRAGLIFVTHHRGEWPECISHVLRLANGRIKSRSRQRRGLRA
jgi:molybdate transport system ATP-binding protein